MLPFLKIQSINWIDGMKINKDHFIYTDQHFMELVRDSRSVSHNSFNYGLVYPNSDYSSGFKLVQSVDGSKILRAVLHTCRAVTSGGNRIEIASSQGIKSNVSTDILESVFNAENSKEPYFSVVVIVVESSRVPVGDPDQDEVPPRIPYIIPQYSLQILPESQFSNSNNISNGLLIGRFRNSSGKISVDETFIPPSMFVKSSNKLEDVYFSIGNLLGETIRNISTILSKVQEKSQSTSLVKSCNSLCVETSLFITSKIGNFRWIFSEAPPIYFLTEILNLAYCIQTSLSHLSIKDREELLNYICEWIEEGTAEISEVINKMIKSEYNHNNIAETIGNAFVFVQLMHKIFLKLSQLDFIGKRKGEGAFVQERITPVEEETPKTQKNKGWSFLAD